MTDTRASTHRRQARSVASPAASPRGRVAWESFDFIDIVLLLAVIAGIRIVGMKLREGLVQVSERVADALVCPVYRRFPPSIT
jgi:hypothetical protein